MRAATAYAGPLIGPGGGHRAPGRGPMWTGGTAFGGGLAAGKVNTTVRRARS